MAVAVGEWRTGATRGATEEMSELDRCVAGKDTDETGGCAGDPPLEIFLISRNR